MSRQNSTKKLAGECSFRVSVNFQYCYIIIIIIHIYICMIAYTWITSPKASVQGHHHPCPCDGLHLDHWAVCSGRGGKGLCLPLCHCQCVSGEKLASSYILMTIKYNIVQYYPISYCTYIPQGSKVIWNVSIQIFLTH